MSIFEESCIILFLFLIIDKIYDNISLFVKYERRIILLIIKVVNLKIILSELMIYSM